MRRKAFTLVELLVVITIIGILVAMLLPSLSNAKYVAEVSVCASSIRQYFVADCTYANDFREYPTSQKVVIYNALGFNAQGEHGGMAGRDLTFNSVLYKSPDRLLTEGQYTTDKGTQCPARTPSPGWPWGWSGNIGTQFYCYNGPGALGDVVNAYGSTSGLFIYGQMSGWGNVPAGADIRTAPPGYTGVSYNERLPTRAIAGCPSLVNFVTNVAYEPHFGQPDTSWGYGSQGDQGYWHIRKRNYVYSDGHAKYANVDVPPW